MFEHTQTLALRKYQVNSLAQISASSVLLFNEGMDIDEIRRENIKALEKQHGAPALAARAGMSLTQFYNLRDGAKDSRTGKSRGMRKETAWRIEEAAGVHRGYLDVPHSDQPNTREISAIPVLNVIQPTPEEILRSMESLLALAKIPLSALFPDAEDAKRRIQSALTHAVSGQATAQREMPANWGIPNTDDPHGFTYDPHGTDRVDVPPILTEDIEALERMNRLKVKGA